MKLEASNHHITALLLENEVNELIDLINNILKPPIIVHDSYLRILNPVPGFF